ncbi:hypothetical protein ACFL6C_05120 [Myxococcota bacterium]
MNQASTSPEKTDSGDNSHDPLDSEPGAIESLRRHFVFALVGTGLGVIVAGSVAATYGFVVSVEPPERFGDWLTASFFHTGFMGALGGFLSGLAVSIASHAQLSNRQHAALGAGLFALFAMFGGVLGSIASHSVSDQILGGALTALIGAVCGLALAKQARRLHEQSPGGLSRISGPSRSPTDAQVVRAGMELLQWRFNPGDWERYTREAASNADKEPNRNSLVASLGVLACLPVIIGGAAVVYVTTTSLGHASWYLLLTLCSLPLILQAVVDRLVPKPSQWMKASPPPPVLFTSTGVIFGESAWLWRGAGYRIVNALLEDYCGHRCLVLSFSPTVLPLRQLATFIRIPIPHHLEKDIREMTQLLEARAKPPKAVPRSR